MDLIDRSKINFYHLTGPELRSAIEEAPTVPAVPLDTLCEMLDKSKVTVPCNDDCEGCEAFDGTGDTVNCWKVTLTKWMEEQDAADRR